VLDVVNHFNWRAALNAAAAAQDAGPQPDGGDGEADNPFTGLATDDRWQEKYFRGHFLASRDAFFFPGSG